MNMHSLKAPRSRAITASRRPPMAIRFINGTPDDSLALVVQHHHFDAFAQSKLWSIDADGNRDSLVATGNKVPFCIATTNINPEYWGERAFGANSYPAPNCLEPVSTSGGFDRYKQGMSVGWTDQYNWFCPRSTLRSPALQTETRSWIRL